MLEPRKTRKSYDITGHAHMLTFSCFKRQPFLLKDRTRQWLADATNLSLEKHNFECWAYVFMPEHVHMLVYSHDKDYEISLFMKSMKQSVSRKAINYLLKNDPSNLKKLMTRQKQPKYRFWQAGGGYDKNHTNEHAIVEAIKYIHLNPVRRGLVSHPAKYEWSSYRDWESENGGCVDVNVKGCKRMLSGVFRELA